MKQEKESWTVTIGMSLFLAGLGILGYIGVALIW